MYLKHPLIRLFALDVVAMRHSWYYDLQTVQGVIKFSQHHEVRAIQMIFPLVIKERLHQDRRWAFSCRTIAVEERIFTWTVLAGHPPVKGRRKVEYIFHFKPRRSSRKVVTAVTVLHTTVWHYLRKKLMMVTQCLHIIRLLSNANSSDRIEFSQFCKPKVRENSTSVGVFAFSGEYSSFVKGLVNKQNCRI